MSPFVLVDHILRRPAESTLIFYKYSLKKEDQKMISEAGNVTVSVPPFSGPGCKSDRGIPRCPLGNPVAGEVSLSQRGWRRGGEHDGFSFISDGDQ